MNREQRRAMAHMGNRPGGAPPFYRAGEPNADIIKSMMDDIPAPEDMEAKFYPLAEFYAAYLISRDLGMSEEHKVLEAYLKERVLSLVKKIKS